MSYVIAESLLSLVGVSVLSVIIGWVAREFALRWDVTEEEPATELERTLQVQMERNMQLRDELEAARTRLRDLDGQVAAQEPERQALEAELQRRNVAIRALEKGIEAGRTQLAFEIRRRAARLAYRVFGDVQQPARQSFRYPRRRPGPAVSAP